MKFPSIKDVAQGLRAINANVECDNEEGCDVRLCVWDDGEWCLRWGLVDYDQSHSPMCGASSVPGVVGGKVQRFDATAVAKNLLDQCKEMCHE